MTQTFNETTLRGCALFAQSLEGNPILLFVKSFGVHRGLFPKVPYVGVGKAHGLKPTAFGLFSNAYFIPRTQY